MVLYLTTDLTIAADEEVIETTDSLAIGFAASVTLLNYGLVRVIGDFATGVATGNWEGLVDNRGLIDAQAQLSAVGVAMNFAQFANSGEIRATSLHSQAIGVAAGPYGFTLTNDGAVFVSGAQFCRGIVFDNHGNIINNGSVDVSVTTDSLAAGLLIGIFDPGMYIINNGDVTVRGPGGVFTSGTTGILVNSYGYNALPTAPSIINTGTISAGTAISSSGVVDWVRNENVINGLITLGFENDRLDNTGTIHGVVDMGGGSDFVDNTAGVIDGEILLGEGNDTFYGGAGAEIVRGGVGNDILRGGGGGDILDGGLSNDTADYTGSNAGVSINLALNYAAGGHAAGDTLISIENLIGSSFADTLIGDSRDNIIRGGAGGDIINGGSGGDTADYTGSNAAVTVNLATGLGSGGHATNDKLTSIEHLIGSSHADTLIGDSGNNRIDGGAGADTMRGGAGNDVYTVDNIGDIVIETPDEGEDWIYASVSIAALAANVERLVLTGTANLNAVGNDLNNVIDGNSGNNRLDGGAGADVLRGGAGDDIYTIDNAGDIVVEAANGGYDWVYSSVTVTALANNVERLVLTGTANLNGTGNASDNVIDGNSGNNRLDGGAGADVLRGGAGNDIYTVDNVGDLVVETANNGEDWVYSSVSIAALFNNVERLVLTGSAAIDGAGNALNNVIDGNSAANVLRGLAGDDTLRGQAGDDTLIGGPGADGLIGGPGADAFVFDAALGGGNIDRIYDFNVADDTIYLDDAVFTALSAGPLAEGQFVIGAAAADADDRIIYNQTTGALFYDADGAGGAAAVQFATLNAGLALTHADFLVI